MNKNFGSAGMSREAEVLVVIMGGDPLGSLQCLYV